YGIGGIRVVPFEELSEFQVGYSRSTDGRSLCGGNGQWRKEWIAIGSETAMGDPLIFDAVTMQVMTAPHGEGEWHPESIAASLEGFRAALEVLRSIAAGRATPDQLEAHPLPERERRAALSRIAAANPDTEMFFWDHLLG